MSKAILVMDMPSSCNRCNLLDEPYDFCSPMDRDVSDYRNTTKPDWCPLKPMPSRKNTEYNPCRNPYIAEGYNACIDEILGGSE